MKATKVFNTWYLQFNFKTNEVINLKNKPIIGLVAKHAKTDSTKTKSIIFDGYKQAVYDNGGIPIGLLSPNEEVMFTDDNWKQDEFKLNKENIINEIKLCDGIILMGGSESEVWEPFIAKYCYDNNIPCLGICAGQNNIVRAVDGTIFAIPNPEDHLKINDTYVHNIKIIDEDSKFYSIIKKHTIKVNSRHQNAVDNNSVLNVVAVCDDNYKDVVEAKNKDFYMGLRFHPESLYKIDENMNNIFKYFIDACKRS